MDSLEADKVGEGLGTAELQQVKSKIETSAAEGSPDHTVVQLKENNDESTPRIHDPYAPFADDLSIEILENEDNILRIRSLVVGIILGGVVNAANVYLGLKTGITFVASLFGSLIGFGVIKTVSKAVSANFPILGGYFGPKENTIIQTSATAAGGLSNIFVSAIPAMYQMGLLKDPVGDYGRIVTITLGIAYCGFFFATPLRKLFIVQLAKQLRLIFPTSTATAATIRSLHIATTGGDSAKKKIYVLLWAFLAALVLRVVSNFAPGILWDWHIFTWFYIWGNYGNLAIFAENWGWYIELSPAVMGTGMMVGMNTAISIFAGSVCSWAIIGPILVRTGAASGLVIGGDSERWGDLTTYASMNLQDPINNPSPRYWLLWPGVLLMVSVSIVEILCQYKIFQHGWTLFVRSLGTAGYLGLKMIKVTPPTWMENYNQQDDISIDEVAARHQIRSWMWVVGLVLSIVVTCVSAGVQWEMPVGMTLVSIIIAGMFTLLAVLSTGMTDMTPLTAVSKSSQLILGGMTRHGQYDKVGAETLNSIGGIVAAGIANQATDLTQDFRVGFLLKTPPRAQWLAQGIASLAAIFLAPAIFLVFAKGYPCILDAAAESCQYSVPSASAWRAATIAATSSTLPIPTSSGIFAICFAVFANVVTVLKHFTFVGSREKYRDYLPNFMAFGTMMVVPLPCIGTAVMIGAIISLLWQKFWCSSWDNYLFSVIAGMISGEGIGGIFNAILAIAGVSTQTGIGCPANMC
ncbi:OPT oligopeptide transporter protein-domain-containing protein [Dactylonectria macrodidyma]|uniref:OPT oligopeptide transporter protein-domain-containing protein n=1 Tax=Dactylonectria macrodidyma TaxID=307937 RepID=A0A9P9FQ49_9HYPO|nr:OPT oligopeptide transporter protein-domain-containing protein [Dactylonectria macrodidyma]